MKLITRLRFFLIRILAGEEMQLIMNVRIEGTPVFDPDRDGMVRNCVIVSETGKGVEVRGGE